MKYEKVELFFLHTFLLSFFNSHAPISPQVIEPPSTVRIAPVVKEDASDAR